MTTRADGDSSLPSEPSPTYRSDSGLDATSTAGWARRIIALCLDWWLSLGVAFAFFDNSAIAPTLIFLLSQVLLVGTFGASLGQFVCGLQVCRQTGGLPGLSKALLRTLLLCLLIPAFATQPGGRRGLHDVAAGTVITRR